MVGAEFVQRIRSRDVSVAAAPHNEFSERMLRVRVPVEGAFFEEVDAQSLLRLGRFRFPLSDAETTEVRVARSVTLAIRRFGVR